LPAGLPVQPPAARMETLRMLVTAYCPCRKCCGRYQDGRTASGRDIHANGSRFVAADTRILPFGTRVSVPGYHDGLAVPVLDRGGRIKGHRLDVFFLSHAQAEKWGARWLDVTVHWD
jgi:3D (Asp-Asp-Asp) domain-containing protein